MLAKISWKCLILWVVGITLVAVMFYILYSLVLLPALKSVLRYLEILINNHLWISIFCICVFHCVYNLLPFPGYTIICLAVSYLLQNVWYAFFLNLFGHVVLSLLVHVVVRIYAWDMFNGYFKGNTIYKFLMKRCKYSPWISSTAINFILLPQATKVVIAALTSLTLIEVLIPRMIFGVVYSYLVAAIGVGLEDLASAFSGDTNASKFTIFVKLAVLIIAVFVNIAVGLYLTIQMKKQIEQDNKKEFIVTELQEFIKQMEVRGVIYTDRLAIINQIEIDYMLAEEEESIEINSRNFLDQ